MTTERDRIITGFISFSVFNLLLTSLCDTAWIIYCMTECWRFAKKYRVCKETPDLHPIYRDVQYLSRQRRLYNLKTHIVKYVLVIMCLSVEMSGIIWTLLYIVLSMKKDSPKMNMERIYLRSKYPKCYLTKTMYHMIFFPLYEILYSFAYFQIFLLFLLLSILSRYLAARYLNHPFRKTLVKYISWLAVQFLIMAICSTVYTLLFSMVLFPLLILINWLVLVRDSRILSRVLKSNLREIELHSNNKVLYREQLSAYKFYRIFQKTLLISLFLLVVVMALNNLEFLFVIAGRSTCLINIVLGLNLTQPNILQMPHPDHLMVRHAETIFVNIVVLLYSISTSIPIISITFIPLVRACILRYKSRHSVYRYNYENIKQPLLN